MEESIYKENAAVCLRNYLGPFPYSTSTASNNPASDSDKLLHFSTASLCFLIHASKSQREFHIFRSHFGPYFCLHSIAYSVSYKISWICHVKFVGNVHCTTIGNTIDAVITNVGPSLRGWHSYVPVRG